LLLFSKKKKQQQTTNKTICVQGGDCSLREAAVVGAALSKMTVPAIHASAALLKLSKITHYNGSVLFERENV
jgi:hypothetical protein